MGESQNLGVGRPLLFSPMEGRDARAWVSLSLRNQVLSLAGGRRSSSGEKQRGSFDAKNDSGREERFCEGVAARHGSLHARGQRPGSLLVLMPSFHPSSARSLATKTPRHTHTSDLPDTQRQMIQPRIPPTADPSATLWRRRAPPQPGRRAPGHVLRDEKRLHRVHPPGRSAPGPKEGRGLHEAANPGHVRFRVYRARRCIVDARASPACGGGTSAVRLDPALFVR